MPTTEHKLLIIYNNHNVIVMYVGFIKLQLLVVYTFLTDKVNLQILRLQPARTRLCFCNLVTL